MRFGKTFSALKLITSSFNYNLNFKHVCIFTNRPGVQKEWLKDFTTLGMDHDGYMFYAKKLGELLVAAALFLHINQVLILKHLYY